MPGVISPEATAGAGDHRARVSYAVSICAVIGIAFRELRHCVLHVEPRHALGEARIASPNPNLNPVDPFCAWLQDDNPGVDAPLG